MPIYDRIKEIREQIGITQSELASRTGINRSTITQIENGKYKDISISKLINISNALNITPSYLLEAERETAEKRILFRAKERLNPEDVPDVSWIIHSLYPRYKALISISRNQSAKGIIPTYNIPFEPISERTESIILIADKERKSLDIKPDQNYNLKSVLSRYADIYETPFTSLDILGFTILNDTLNRPLIIINSLINPNQKRFILAHEYGHLLFDREKVSNIIELRNDWYSNDDVEVRANQFAAEFLIPAKDIYFHSDKVNEKGLAFLMNEYHVSRQVVVNRWLNLNLINNSQKEHFDAIKPIQLMKIHGYDNDEIQYYDNKFTKIDAYTSIEKLPIDYLQFVKEAYIAGKISYNKIAYYCFIQSEEIEKWLGITKEELDEYEQAYG